MDFNKPELKDHYAAVLESLRVQIADLARWLEDTTPDHTPVGTKRWSEGNQRFERFDGTVWQPLAKQTGSTSISWAAGRRAARPGRFLSMMASSTST